MTAGTAPIAPIAPKTIAPKPIALTPLGDQSAAVCIDGVCEIPGAAAAYASDALYSGSVMSTTDAPNAATSSSADTKAE